MSQPPRIVVTVQAPSRHADPALAERKNALYLEAVRRAGGDPLALDELTPEAQRRAALASMDGLLLTGGADIEPARYGQAPAGSEGIEAGRDDLEWAAWLAALDRGLPVLGICRGLQAINVFSGGRLVQHLDGHESPAYGKGPSQLHPLRLASDSRLAAIVGSGDGGDSTFTVNTYHHQGVRPEDLGPGLRATGLSPWAGPTSPAGGPGELVEALESVDPERFIVAVQCHPERTESTPSAFANLFGAFVEAARTP